MSEQKNQSNQIQIKADDETLKGRYATMVQVAHGGEEFVIDFMNHMPPVGQLVSRVIVSPSHFKRLAKAMQDNIDNYEKEFGTIQLQVVPDQTIGFKTE
jgi:hypothetical protein